MPENDAEELPTVKVTPAAYTAILKHQGQLQSELGVKVTIPETVDVLAGVRKKHELKKEGE